MDADQTALARDQATEHQTDAAQEYKCPSCGKTDEWSGAFYDGYDAYIDSIPVDEEGKPLFEEANVITTKSNGDTSAYTDVECACGYSVQVTLARFAIGEPNLFTWKEAARLVCTNSPGGDRCVDLSPAVTNIVGLCRTCEIFAKEAGVVPEPLPAELIAHQRQHFPGGPLPRDRRGCEECTRLSNEYTPPSRMR